MQKGDIEIYKTATGTEIQVKLDRETVWLDAHLISDLFEVNRPAIVKHIGNIYKSGELQKDGTCSILEQVAADGKKRKMNLYNLDVIISVGYRVNSKQATQFRQWATQRLKDYLIHGVAINQKRLEQLQQTIQLIATGGTANKLGIEEAKGLLEIINSYTRSFALLNQYDSRSLSKEQLEQNVTYEIQYDEARTAIDELKKQLKKKGEATNLFGNEKDDGFKSALQSIVQTFGGEYLYPSIEEQAASLLYFIIKNHSSLMAINGSVLSCLFGFWIRTNIVSSQAAN